MLSYATDIEEQLVVAVARKAHSLLSEEGHDLAFDERIDHAAAPVNAPPHLLEHTLGALQDRCLIWNDRGTNRVLPLAVHNELESERGEFHRRNNPSS
jgi:hypothetical protein